MPVDIYINRIHKNVLFGEFFARDAGSWSSAEARERLRDMIRTVPGLEGLQVCVSACVGALGRNMFISC